jgi:hypothetical protein
LSTLSLSFHHDWRRERFVDWPCSSG